MLFAKVKFRFFFLNNQSLNFVTWSSTAFLVWHNMSVTYSANAAKSVVLAAYCCFTLVTDTYSIPSELSADLALDFLCCQCVVYCPICRVWSVSRSENVQGTSQQ